MGDGVGVAHAEGVAVLLLRCLTVIHDFLVQGALFSLAWARHEGIGMTLACMQRDM
jgi:uncharacterized RDD family membrane protein YckC